MNKTNKTCTNNIGVRFLPITLKHPQESCKKRPSYAEDFGFEIGGNERVNLMQNKYSDYGAMNTNKHLTSKPFVSGKRFKALKRDD